MLVGAAALGAAAAIAIVSRARLRNWGATAEEMARQLPGDELIPDADTASTRAITIDAPRSAVWRWLVQVGQDRGGWYSYDWLENAFGLDIHSTDEIREEWQQLSVGDQVRVIPPGALGLPDGYAFRVALVEPPHVLVLRQQPPEHPVNATWAFVLVDETPETCRMLVRSRSKRHEGPAGMVDRAGDILFDPITLIMTRRMLLGLRERAESHRE